MGLLISTAGGVAISCSMLLGCGQPSASPRGEAQSSGGHGTGGETLTPVGTDGGSPNYADFPDLMNMGGAGPAAVGDPLEYAAANGWVEPESPDDRPAAPEWDLDERWGDPSWKESAEPFCTGFAGLQHAVNLWADDTGVFALFASGCAIPLGGNPDLSLCTKFGFDGRGSVQFNDGQGWQTVGLFGGGNVAKLAGFPDGRRVAVLESAADGGPCPLAFMDFSGRLECSSFSYSSGVNSPGFIGVGPGAGYFFQGGDVHLYDGSWRLFGESQSPSNFFASFASKHVVALAGSDGYVAARTTSEPTFEALPNVPEGDYNAVWAAGPSDLWLMNAAGEIVHFMDGQWETHQTTALPTGPLWHLWGDSAGRIYYASTKVLARWSDGEEEILIAFDEYDGRTITSVAPVSDEQIFVSVFDMPANDYQCGGARILWFDGELFHRF